MENNIWKYAKNVFLIVIFVQINSYLLLKEHLWIQLSRRELIINMDINTIITFLACIIFLFIFGKIFIWPLKSVLKLVFNSILGGILIYVINLIGMNFGFHIGLNLLTAIIVGLLGVPGAALLIILKIILRIRKMRDCAHFSFIQPLPT